MLCAVDSNRYNPRIRGELRTKLEHQHFVSRLLSRTQPHQRGKGPRRILTNVQSLSALISQLSNLQNSGHLQEPGPYS